MKVKNCFDKKGNFKKPLDPYRCDKSDPIYSTLFTDSGKAINIDAVGDLICKNNWGLRSDDVRYFYSSYIDDSCGGNYTAIYMWR